MECECPIAGWCKRHQRVKTPHLHWLCQTDSRFREIWDGKKHQSPGIVQRGWSYLKAVTKWKLSGEPVRTPEQINEIFETHCKPCEHFLERKDRTGSCKLCGCSLNKQPDGVKNKIAMLTEGCPIEKWTSPIQS